MAYTLAEATEFYEAAKEGYKAALRMTEYSIKERSAKREKLDLLSREMDKWKAVVDDLESGTASGIKFKRGVPLDT